MEKKRIVENDKRKIELVIEELDEKKNQALKTTWTKVCMCAWLLGRVLYELLLILSRPPSPPTPPHTQVNRDFSSIFHTLLPNARAKLEPPEGGTVLDGLVMKVGFGDCWKDSLSELSGGQRSLLAVT